MEGESWEGGRTEGERGEGGLRVRGRGEGERKEGGGREEGDLHADANIPLIYLNSPTSSFSLLPLSSIIPLPPHLCLLFC